MERNIQKNGLVNLLILLLTGMAAFAVSRHCNSSAALVGAVYLGLGLLVAAVSWFQMRLEEGEKLEKLELEELARGHGESALFAGKDEMIPTGTEEQFRKAAGLGKQVRVFPGRRHSQILLQTEDWRQFLSPEPRDELVTAGCQEAVA